MLPPYKIYQNCGTRHMSSYKNCENCGTRHMSSYKNCENCGTRHLSSYKNCENRGTSSPIANAFPLILLCSEDIWPSFWFSFLLVRHCLRSVRSMIAAQRVWDRLSNAYRRPRALCTREPIRTMRIRACSLIWLVMIRHVPHIYP